MTTWAIVPVKPLSQAKSRLSGVLSREERIGLCLRMFIHTLDILSHVESIDCTLVVSKDSNVLTMAREHNARTITERGSPHLNQALEHATQMACGFGVSTVLVLPADLPLLTKEVVDEFLSMSANPPVLVIAPDRHGTGTNALITSPPGLIEYDFGSNSLNCHIARAEAAGARVEVCQLPSLGLDIDLPEDLELFEAERTGTSIPKSEE
jgi:2-phospho-L-lactate guanylyltransferase